MKIALLGATGFVGSALLEEALERGQHPEHIRQRFTVGYME